jgi:hypothetical protein
MPVCPICKVTFHSCSSCHHNTHWEYEYCSTKCWGKSNEYKKYCSQFKALYSTVNEAQKKMLLGLLLEMSDDYLEEVINWKKEVEKRDESKILY